MGFKFHAPHWKVTGTSGALIGASLGMGVGAIPGYMIGSAMEGDRKARALQNEQERLAREAQENQDGQIATLRTAYGYVGAGQTPEQRQTALTNRAAFGSAVDNSAEATRDSALAPLLQNAQRAASQGRMAAARTGQLGGSIDQQNRQNVLQSFIGGRASIASGVQNQRAQAQAGLQQERLSQENAVRNNSSAGMEQMFAAQRGLAAIQAARNNIPAQTFGNLLGTAGSVVGQGMQMQAMGAPGLGMGGGFGNWLGGDGESGNTASTGAGTTTSKNG